MSTLPWRERVEVYAIDVLGGAVLGGIYSDDKTFGVPGGGVDPGEDLLAAARRELMEETGYVLEHPTVIPVPVLEHRWSPPYATPAQADRSSQFCGSRTHFIWGEVGEQVMLPAEPHGLEELGMHPLLAALKWQARSLADADHPDRVMHRMACLIWLHFRTAPGPRLTAMEEDAEQVQREQGWPLQPPLEVIRPDGTAILRNIALDPGIHTLGWPESEEEDQHG